MTDKYMRNHAQVVPFLKSNAQDMSQKVDDMKKTQISSDCYRKLNRSGAVSGYVHVDLANGEVSGVYQFLIPHLFSYLHDDITDVLDELKEKGLCDAYFKNKNNGMDNTK